jgi:hypothetical protein
VSRSTIHVSFNLDSSPQPNGQPGQPIATGNWIGPPVNIEEHRRINITCGILPATGAANDCGGYTGNLVVQGTDEIVNGNFPSGAPYAGMRTPGGPSGGVCWQTIPSGTFAVTKATQVFSLSFTDVGFSFIRVAFNATGGGTGPFSPAATGCLGGSGLWNVSLTAKGT